MNDAVLVRDLTEADLDEVAAIYSYESTHAYSTFETEQRPAASWRPRLSNGDVFLVAEVAGRVRGFAYGSPFRDRPAYHRTRETSVYVHREARGQRLGTLLYAALLPRLRDAGMHTALALIALPNDGSVRLHEQHGFQFTGTMHEVGDKQDRMIDVAIFQLML
jgi:L-amino acid N-acyltransferase